MATAKLFMFNANTEINIIMFEFEKKKVFVTYLCEENWTSYGIAIVREWVLFLLKWV